MERERQYVLNHLKDMFGTTFDEDIIESVLMQRNWNVDRAVDDLMTMTIGNNFEIPVEEIDVCDLPSNALVKDLVNSEMNENSLVTDDAKMSNEDDGIVILDEEEYVVPTASDDSESNESEQPQFPPQAAAKFRPPLSYSSIVQKPAKEDAKTAPNNNAMRAKPPFIVYQGFTSYDRIKRSRDSIERVKLYVQNRFKIMVILRGCPGSGKSTLAKNILKECAVKNNPYMHIHSTDNFFSLNREGRYMFDLSKIHEAHNWNHANLLSVIRQGLTPIIVDNTNTQLWEMEHLASMAVCAGYEMEVIEPDTPWALNLNYLASKNTHRVPRDKLCLMLDRYDHNVSATTLLKCFNLKYVPSQLPPQKGVRTLGDPALVAVFDRIYQTLEIFPQMAPKHVEVNENLTKKQKKKERKRLRKLIEEEAAAAAAFVELDDLTETDSANSNHNAETDGTIDDEEDLVEKGEESDSDQSWLTMDEEISDVSCCEEESDITSSCNSDARNESFEKQETDSVDNVSMDVSTPLSEGTCVVDDKPQDLIPALNDTLENPLNLNRSSPIAVDNIVETSGSRLKCFERLRDDGKKEGSLESCATMNNSSGIESWKQDSAILTNPIGCVSNDVNWTNMSVVGSSKTTPSSSTIVNFPELLSESIENSDAESSFCSKKTDGNSNLMNALENFALSVTKAPSPIESAFSGEKIIHNLNQDADLSPDKNCLMPEKMVDNIYNADAKDKRFKLCNVEGERNFSAECTSETACSLKFKDDREKNMIANDLWGIVDEQNDRDPVRLQEKELSDDNSDNSDSRSNSSSSDETAMADVHNTSNRFVNNDITNEQSERKKPDINREKRNQNLVDDTVDNGWTMADSMTPDLNTLKERILINSLDKVFNQNQHIEPSAESTNTATIDKQINLPPRRSNTSTPFYIIENRLKNEPAEGSNSSRSDDFEDAVDSLENRVVSQWMRGDTWGDENRKESQGESKKSETDVKPQRKIRQSPSKQKNTEMAANRFVVNDIKNLSDTSKLCSLLDKNNKNQDSVSSQSLKSINFQSFLRSDRTASASSSLNTIQRVPSKEEDIESDFEAKSKSFLFSDDQLFESQRKNLPSNRPYQSPFRNFDANESQFWPGLSDNACSLWGVSAMTEPLFPWSGGQRNNGSPELSENSIVPNKNIVKDENSSDLKESVSKWNPFSDTCTKLKPGEASTTETKSCYNFFVPVDIMNQERNKATNTGWDDGANVAVIKMGRCREINEGRRSPEKLSIKASYKCDKSTMTDASNYTLKAKPLREDLVNIFPSEMVDVILDLYEKCNGNMDWILEILMEDGYSPSDDQLEYLSSLQNVMDYQTTQRNIETEKVEKNKKIADKKRSKGRNSKNGRGNNLQIGEGRKKPESGSGTNEFRDFNHCEETDMVVEEHVDLFLDWSTVSQLLAYFGNPTIYSIKDYQPTVKLPLSLARQLHAYLIGSIIDQAEENEDLINQLSEEDYSMSTYLQNSGGEEFSLNDVSDVENSLSDILKDPHDMTGKSENMEATTNQTVVRSKDSFASKLSLNLLLKAFPTLDPSFVKSTFRAQNFNYYDTKNVLNQYGREVPIDAPQIKPLEEDMMEDEGDVQFFANHSTNPADTRNEVLQQVTEYRRNAALNQRQWRKCHESLCVAIREKKFGVAAYYRDMMNVFKQKYEECNAHAATVLINSSCLQNSDLIDLHYFKVTDALKALDKFLDQHLSRLMCSGRSRMPVYIVTGRGSRSVNGISRIQPPVKNRLKHRQITFEIESHNTGLVKAILRKNSLMSTDL